MKRRNILGYAATGVATAALAACSPQNTGPAVQSDSLPRVRWKMATSWPTSLDTLYGAAELIAELVSKLTDGRFTIQTFAAGEIVPGLQVLDAIQQGTVECGHTASYYYIGKNPALTFGTCVPFGLNTQQQMAWLYHGGGIEAMNKLYADFNTIAFPAGNSGAQMGGWFKREVNNIADLNGLKMRIPGLGGEVLSRLGVNVQVLPGGEIFLALERGAIDAAEFVGPYDDEKLGLNNAARLYYYPGWWEPGSSFDLQINLTAWNRLPTEYQEILKTAASAANIQTLAKYDVQNPQALKRLIDGGTQLKAFSPEILQASLAATTDLLEDMAIRNSSFRDIYEPWKQFRDSIRQWHAVGEFAFSNFVSTPILEGL
ncbi:TRAP dicarboxylate transporter- DctP subunit [Limnospira maxima CS-328]|uniref:TRAP dicarboxylate transporter-DctP subunit n=1 Tax=Limnospira maxima CS-328 TaxID=513049 RepID=B5W8D7_LIMMA|nr:TRAP transporter substrate-binding protein [Limnospira maxima]EDZ92195.1 TRAP dicarboxylate transporter- DctP subunit [Limnospira maxima CS-328]MDC0837677.1 TRAP transporter substrate-binding protein [Limnoraphis robusta]